MKLIVIIVFIYTLMMLLPHTLINFPTPLVNSTTRQSKPTESANCLISAFNCKNWYSEAVSSKHQKNCQNQDFLTDLQRLALEAYLDNAARSAAGGIPIVVAENKAQEHTRRVREVHQRDADKIAWVPLDPTRRNHSRRPLCKNH